MRLVILSGGPSTGKTAVINELAKRDYPVLYEGARKIANSDKRFYGKSIKEINMRYFQEAIFESQKKEIEILNKKNIDFVFSDRGFGDTLAYFNVYRIKIPEKFIEYAKNFNSSLVFILENLKFYKKDSLRQESRGEMKEIHNKIIEMYKELGYKIIFVPLLSISERVEFILKRIQNL